MKFWSVWSLASSLSNNITLNFQWVPGHTGLPGNENADLLPKLVPPCPLTRSHAFSLQSLPKSVISSTTIGDITSSTSTLPTKSPKSLRRNCSFLALFAVSFPVFAAMITVFFYLHIFTGSVGKRILLVVPVDTLYRTSIISSSTVLPLNLFVYLSLAPLSLSILDHRPHLARGAVLCGPLDFFAWLISSWKGLLSIFWQIKRYKPKPSSVWFSQNQFGFAAKTFFFGFHLLFGTDSCNTDGNQH